MSLISQLVRHPIIVILRFFFASETRALKRLSESACLPCNPRTGAFDSLSAVELANKLGRELGIELPSTLVFDYPSVESLLSFVSTLTQENVHNTGATVAENLSPPSAQPSLACPDAATSTAAKQGCSQVVALKLASRLPDLSNPGFLMGLKDAITTVPYGRWDLSAAQVPSHTSQLKAHASVTFDVGRKLNVPCPHLTVST